jgi:glycosyltransferase involved in cell wall biosynthesis
MKLLFCVQRYGQDVAGGSEAACRDVAERLTRRGHDVEVVTSRARSYADWDDHYPEGASVENDVVVHRLSVREPRRPDKFAAIHGRMLAQPHAPLFMQRDWLRLQGPDVADLAPWLHENAPRFDVAVFFTYLYPTTAFGLPIAAEHCPTVLVPTAHEEPMFEWRVFDELFRAADAFVFLTPEERELVRARFRFDPPGEVVGLGIDEPTSSDAPRFRTTYGLGDRPYVVFLGRIDPGKGSDELHRYFAEIKRRDEDDLALVVLGESVVDLPPHPDVIVTGFVDERTKHDALAGALALVQPSYFESFSIALCEAWSAAKPALVQGRCEVLVGQSRRSGGGLPYDGFSNFAESLRRLRTDDALRSEMGASGRRYVREQYRWDHVIDRYEALLQGVAASGTWRFESTAPPPRPPLGG